jgi:UDP-2,3-diacylglucosamine hydrolase
MKTIFLADVHLKRRSDPGYEKCMQLFASLRKRGAGSGEQGDDRTIAIDLLVIAGDFFDFWFEKRGRIYPEFRPIVESLVRLRNTGIRVCLCEGNHDFFLADYFTKQLGIEVYPADAEFMLDGRRCLVSHGDTVDVSNRRYLALRRLLRSSFAYGIQRALPLRWLWRVAQFSSKVSKDRSGEGAARLSGVMHGFAVGKYREGFDAVILGHCHVPSFREEQIVGRPRIFATLGDWVTHHNYLLCEEGKFKMHRFIPCAQAGDGNLSRKRESTGAPVRNPAGGS